MGIWITEELLRSKAEHNEGVLYTLEEISLHQLEIDRITMLNSCCRELKILYLQNNNIRRIENLGFARSLTHLYLQNNQITKIEGLETLGNLTKLCAPRPMLPAGRGLRPLRQWECAG